MKNTILCLVFYILFQGFSFSQEGLTIVSYNIRLDVKSDAEDNWEFRKDAMIAYFTELDADFVCIQEGLPHQVSFIDESMANWAYVGIGREEGSTGEFCAIFYDTSTWMVLNERTFWLSETPGRVSKGWDAACNRICTMAEFTDKRGESVLIMNTHFDHVGVEARQKSAQLILDTLTQIDDSRAIILLGDFNLKADNEVYSLLTSNLTDAGFNSEKEPNYMGTLNAFKLENHSKRRIDYIFYNHGLDLLTYRVDQPLSPQGRQVSDHYPVVAKLKVKKQ